MGIWRGTSASLAAGVIRGGGGDRGQQQNKDDIKGSGDRLDRCGKADKRQGGLKEDSARDGRSRGEVGLAEGT